jgi:hypothetical protein
VAMPTLEVCRAHLQKLGAQVGQKVVLALASVAGRGHPATEEAGAAGKCWPLAGPGEGTPNDPMKHPTRDHVSTVKSSFVDAGRVVMSTPLSRLPT